MSQKPVSYTAAPDKLVQLLANDLPYSLPLLRRLQFSKFPHGTTPHARTVFVADVGSLAGDKSESLEKKRFTAVYIDFSTKTETQAYIYSTLEHSDPSKKLNDDNREEYEKQILNIVREILHLRDEYCLKSSEKHTNILVGSIHSDIRTILDKLGRVAARPTGFYDKWLLLVHEVPRFDESLPQGMHWDSASLEDCRVIVSRTDIPRTPEFLSRMPSLVIKLEDKTPIAWALLGVDGTLISVHCEEAYRRKGLAKTTAAKLLREKASAFGSDGWSAADVAATNDASRGMCKALGGKPDWTVSWINLLLFDEESST